MQITVVNYSTYPDEKVQTTVRAINRQIREDFRPYWGMEAILRLGRRTGRALDPQNPVEMRGDAVLYMLDEVTDPGVDDILGYHAENGLGVPFGFVYTAISDRLGEPWSVTLSHEALELLGDANVNKLAAGPDPRDPGHPDRYVLHWFEMCDAVQSESYRIDGVAVSNFVTPLYFTIGEQDAGRNDFLSRVHRGRTLPSFGVNPGGYIGFLDPLTNTMDMFPADDEARRRLAVKSEIRLTRRAVRYRDLPERVASREAVLFDDLETADSPEQP
jgi:hypothetical protein